MVISDKEDKVEFQKGMVMKAPIVDEHNDIIKQIIALELEMFLAVPAGGENSCQQNPEAFCRHRKVQFLPWSTKTLHSYLADLKSARIEGRNLMTHKYLMMDNPAHQTKQNPLIVKIVLYQLAWQREMFIKYPCVMNGARPLKESTDSISMTSFETYLKSELRTYSDKTLALLSQDISDKQKIGVNMAEETYEFLVQATGYSSLKQAESILSSRND